MRDLSKTILKDIQEKHILPKPRWSFILKNYIIWLLGILFLVVGSLSSAVIIHMLRNNDWDLSERLAGGKFSFFLATLPYFWIIVLLIFIFVAYQQIKHTNKGYRYHLYNIIIVLFIFSVLLGQIFYNLKLGENIDNYLADNFEIYGHHLCNQVRFLNNPERGVIVGRIIGRDANQLKLVDIKKNNWQIMLDEIKDDFQDNRFITGERIRVIGQKINPSHFIAHEIRFSSSCHCQQGNIVKNKPCMCSFERK